MGLPFHIFKREIYELPNKGGKVSIYLLESFPLSQIVIYSPSILA